MRFLTLIVLFVLIITPVAASNLIPVVANSGFEESVAGNDTPGWGSYSRANASFRIDTQNPHSGKRCLVFTNASPTEPEVYLRFYQGIGVMPSTQYEITLWVRGEKVGSGQHFTDWSSYTLNLPDGDFGWTKVSTVFTTKSDQTGINLGINVVNVCKELAIDDISIRPIGAPLNGKGISGTVLVPGQINGDNTQAYIGISATSTLPKPATVEAVVKVGKDRIFEKHGDIKPGDNSIEWQWKTSTHPVRDMTCTVRVLDGGKVIASVDRKVTKLSPAVISGDLDRTDARFKQFDALYEKCIAKGIPVDYPTVTRTMLKQFVPLARNDVKVRELARANYAVRDFDRSLSRSIAEMQAYLKNPKLAPNARRYKTGKVDIKGVSFIGDRKDAKGKTSRGPVFFCGYGHFIQVREDMPRWPGYGVNIIQVEVGPSITFPKESQVSLEAANDIVGLLDQAASNNVMVNILLSPHYFPGWAMEKWPHLGKGGGGFFGYCVDAPEAKQVLEKFLRAVVPLFKDMPALHSFCLSNEPLFDRTTGCDNTRAMWTDYLEKTHGDIGTLNTRYRTRYASFADVPISLDAKDPQFYDYCIFNNLRLAAFHKWMADIIHEMAPDVPVHAKIMDSLLFQRSTIGWGVDPELFGELSQINGNDNYAFPANEDSMSWGSLNMGYDLQRSLNFKPVFNSENHLAPDGSTYYIRPEHFRSGLWQGAIHGQGATTIWVWERVADRADPKYKDAGCFIGSVMDRPGCAEQVGLTTLDLNRFAEEVTALQNVKAPVAILWSDAAKLHDVGYFDAMNRAYSALNFLGIKIDFISEKQLAAGKGSQYRMIILPDTAHITVAAFEALKGLKSRLVFLGDPPSYDPYGNEFAESLLQGTETDLAFEATADPKDLSQVLRTELAARGQLPEVSVVDAKTGKPAWGVEWLPTQVNGRTVINIMNLTDKPVDVRVLYKGKPADARDLLSLGGLEKAGHLKPLTPVLAEIRWKK